jgi:hypothetical protein
MKGMKAKLTSSETANDPDSRINKSLRAWNCADGGAIRPELGAGGDAIKAAMKIAQNVIKSYHYSPHQFDKFDINKIGTGHGKDAYGAGLYLGADEPTAQTWRSLITKDKGVPVSSGHMYEVDAALDPERMIDYNKYLYEQPEFVKDALRNKLGYEHYNFEKPANEYGGSPRGEVAVPRSLGALNAWRDAGLHGTKYYDPNTSTRGYVSYSDEPLSIVRRYYNGGEVRPEMGAGGSGIKAAVNLAKNIIKTYHGSPHQFDKFDLDKLGSGVGAQAYGHGLYTSDNPNVARGYRTVIPGRVPNPYAKTPNEMTIGGKPVYSVYKDIERQANNVPITEASKYYDKLDVLERLMHEGDALAIKQAASDEAFSPEAYKWFQTHVEPKLNTPGGLYEINLHADPKKFIDLYAQMPLKDPLRERVESLAQHGLQNADAETAYRDAQEAMKTVRRKDIFGSDLQGALDTLLDVQGSKVREAAGVAPDIKGPEAVSRYLNREGYAGFTYPHGLDAPGPELLNRVVFDPKVMEIVKRYGQGGEVRPEMGGGGKALSAAVKMAQDIIKAYHASGSKFDKFDNSKIGSGVGAQAYGKGHYLASSDPVARGYLGPDAQYDRMSGKMNPKEEFAFDIATNASDPTSWTIIKPLVEKYGSNISYDEAEKLAEEALAKRGHMYEVGINANPEHFLDWDKRFAEQSPYIQERLTPQNLRLLPGGPEGPFNGRRAWVDETGLPLGRMTTASEPPRSVFTHGDTAPYIYRHIGREDPTLSSEKLQAAGIAGIKYLDPSFRHLGEGSRNYVVFNPDILDIMRRYADGGSVDRLHFDDGGIARIEELLRQAKGEEQATQASHPVGMSGNVEFAPVEIDEPITGSKIPLGSLPAPTAAVANPIANILAQYGPYAMGPIPAGMAAARDLVTGLKEGSGLDVATAAMGAPGKLAKYGLPALGAATDLLSPTEAQAGTGSKLVKGLSSLALRRPELLRAEHPYFPEGFRDKIAGIVSPFSNDEDIAKAAVEMAQKYRTPLENKSNITGGYYGPIQSVDPLNVTRKIGDIPGIKLLTPTPEQTYEDLYKVGKGGTLVNLAGDRSDFGRLTHIGGKKLDFPVDVHAGPKYSLEPNPGEVWANDPSHAGKLKETVAKGEEKGPVVGLYTPMGPQSISSSQHMFEALMAQIKGSGASKDDLDAFDKVIRSGAQFGNDKKNADNAVEYMKGNFGKNKQIGPWPGLSNPKEAAEWAKNLPGHHRAAIVNEMEKARWKKLGFPEVGVTRVALTDPSLMSTPQNLIGGRASMLSSTNPRGAEPLFQHSTYGSPTYGQYLMDLPFVQRQYAMPEAIKKYTSPTETGTVVHPFSEQSLGRGSFRKLFETNFLTQPINQEWLDTLMTGLERQKQYGFNRGGKAN